MFMIELEKISMGHNKISCYAYKRISACGGLFLNNSCKRSVSQLKQSHIHALPFYNQLPITINYNKLYFVMFVYIFNICDVRKINLSYKHAAKHVHDRILEKKK